MEQRLDEPLITLSTDECGDEVDDSDEDIITDYHIPILDEMLLRGTQTPQNGSGGNTGGITNLITPLPTISVTPHSPATKTYPVLEDSLQQVRELHESVQRMREATVQGQTPKDFAALALNPLLAHVARLSASCPVLNEQAIEVEIVGGSLGSSPVHNTPSRKGSGAHDWLLNTGLAPDPQRRKSWTALEDLTGTKDKLKARQRSISSSGESEADESSLLDNVDGSTSRLLGADPALVGRRSHRGSTGGSSTHSLNEADLQKDFNKIKAKRDAEQLRLLPARLPLQKSVSTPSIIAVRELAPEGALGGAQPTLPVGRPSGTESETEEELTRSGHTQFDPRTIALLDHVPYDHHSEKRRKRGSLFFRKKKDKIKKAAIHQWVSPVCGSSQLCDVCSKPLSNKPALCCDNCGTTVHQNTCKDNIAECNKPKSSKNTNKISGLVGPLTNSKSSLTKRGSGSMPAQNQTTRRSQLCYSPWRRVATKLGVNQILSDDKEADHGHHDNTNFPDDVPIVPLEFLRDTPLTAADLCADPLLGLHLNEPDTWTPHVGKEIARKLKEKEVKRQEHIYEFLMTEKHHCMTLLVMKKIFSEGLQKYFNLGSDLDRMFPRLADLIEIHQGFLLKLRHRQRESPIVNSIADILLEQFSTYHSAQLKSAYGEFCSRHRDAVKLYKSYLRDPRFGQFVTHCQNNPLLKKKGIPECILFVTQRLTKYPLLIEPLIKTSKENRHEQETLQKALALIKEILVEVDSQVAEKEKEERKLEIYYRIDAKSYTVHRGYKFKKSDILQGNRALRFEGVAMLMQGRGKMQVVMVIVLSDVLFFLQESSHNKYTFFTPDNKAGVISLQKLLVREKAGQESRGIYLISSNPSDPEMFELKVHKPKDKHVWIQAIRAAVQNCPEDEEGNFTLSTEEKQTLMNAKQNQIRHIVDGESNIEGLLRQKDVEQALLLEEKMSLQIRLLTAAGLEPPSPPSYRHLVGENVDPNQVWREVLTAVQEVSHLASSLYTTGTNLSRSVSSAGEHQSETYVSPILPKRAETFGGFDQSSGGIKLLGRKLQSSSGTPTLSPDLENLKPGDARIFEKLPWRNCQIGGPTLTNGNTPISDTQSAPPPDIPALLSLGKEQQYAAVQLSHYVYTLLCIISQLMTSNETLQAHLGTMKGNMDGTKYRHNQQLEELRNLQDKLCVEKTAWAATREQETKEIEEKKTELLKLQEQIRAEQSDIKQQRDQLYRKMEILTSQGLLISPNVALPVTGQFEDNSSNQSSEESSPSQSDGSLTHSFGTERRKETKWAKCTATSKSQLPQHLISASNQQKVQQNIHIKQQLPLKLATKLSSGTSVSPSSGPQQMLPLKLSQDEKVRRISTSGYQRLGSGSRSPTSGESTPTTPSYSHSRTGSSPAMMQGSPPPHQSQNGAKTVRTNTYPKIPDEYKVRGEGAQTNAAAAAAAAAADEEVMYF